MTTLRPPPTWRVKYNTNKKIYEYGTPQYTFFFGNDLNSLIKNSLAENSKGVIEKIMKDGHFIHVVGDDFDYKIVEGKAVQQPVQNYDGGKRKSMRKSKRKHRKSKSKSKSKSKRMRRKRMSMRY